MSGVSGEGRYLLIPRGVPISESPSGSNYRSYRAAPHAYRIWTLTLRAQGPDGRLISHNMQVKLGPPDLPRERADAQVALWLPSGWWATLRHEFALKPEVATPILASVADELSEYTTRMTTARGEVALRLAYELQEEHRFAAIGPAEWPGP